MQKKILSLLVLMSLLSMTVFAFQKDAQKIYDEELKLWDKQGYTLFKNTKWVGTLNAGNKFKKTTTLMPDDDYCVIAGSDNKTNIDIIILDSKNNQVAKTSVNHHRQALKFKPEKKDLYTMVMENNTKQSCWIYFALLSKTKEEAKPEPKQEPEPEPKPEPKPDPILPPAISDATVQAMPTGEINIPVPPTLLAEKSIDGLPLPKETKEKSLKNHILSAPAGNSMRTLGLYKFKKGNIGRLEFKLLGKCAGKPGYKNTVEFWMNDNGIAISIEANNALKYHEVTKDGGYKEIKLDSNMMKGLPVKLDTTNFYRLRVMFSANKVWFFIGKINVLQVTVKDKELPFFARVTGASVELRQTETKPEELKFVVDANNKDIIQDLPNFSKGVQNFAMNVTASYGKDRKVLEFWFNKQTLTFLEMEDGTFKFYSFDGKNYIEIALPKSFTFNKNKPNTVQFSREGSNVWLVWNDLKLGVIQDKGLTINCKMRVKNYKIVGLQK